MKEILHFIKVTIAAFLSRRLIMAVSAIYMIYLAYWGSITMLYTFENPAQIAAFQALTSYFLWGTCSIAMWFIGVQTASNFKNGLNLSGVLQNVISSSSIDETITQKIEITEKVDQRIVEEFAQKYAGDLSYRPILPNEQTEEVWR